MPSSRHPRFDLFQLDPLNARLLQNGQPVALTPKAFDLLAFLCGHPGELISKDVLLDAVWQRRFISEGVLKNAIQELRRALGDAPRSPRYIETVHRRGYRFLGFAREHGMTAERMDSAMPTRNKPADTNIVVGRDELLDRLCKLLGSCMDGHPQAVFLSGEAGIGKTTLMQRFGTMASGSVSFVGGQCVEHYGEVEPYQPLLEALNQLGRRYGHEFTEALRRYAPTWLVQLPWLLDDADRDALQKSAQNLALERMQREFCAFLEHWTGEQSHSLVLMLEDLHWSDHATLDVITYLAHRPGQARWMILGSYRPADVFINEHPLRRVMSELKLHRLCHDFALELLPEAPMMQYLERRFADAPLSKRLMRAIGRRTEGLPLYLAHLSNELVVWRERHPQGTDQEIEAFFETLPENLKLFIEQLFSRLPAESQVFLDAAAVAGNGFSPAMLAAVTGGDVLTAEDWCERLARDRHILRRAGPPRHPERRKSGRYAFIHAYYQELAYERVPVLRRAGLHLAIAEWLEASCGRRTRDLAAEIAMHFENGRHYEKALNHLRIAVENALGRHEPHAVSALCRRAIEILEHHLPPVPENAPVTVELYTTLATAMQATHGFAKPELQPIFERLLSHEQTLDDNPHQLPILWAMMAFHFVRGQLRIAEQYAQRMLDSGQGAAHIEALVCGHVGQTGVGLYTGRLEFALEHFRAAQTLFHHDHGGLFPVAAVHPMVLGNYFAAKTHWLRGFPDKALDLIEEGMAVARADAHPFSLAFIHWGEIVCRQLRGDLELTEASGQAFMANADYQSFELMSALAITQRGWALASLGCVDEGIESMQRGIAAYRATGTYLSGTFLLAYCADAFLRLGLLEQGRTWLEEAFEIMERTDERCFEAELHRLKGETVMMLAPAEAERHFQSAVDIARRQGALSLELRAAMSLAKLWISQSRGEAARSLLGQVYSMFSEGFDTRDLREARALLEAANAG